MELLVGFYQDADPARTAEFIECARRNAANPHLDRVTVFLEDRVTPSDVAARHDALTHPKVRLLEHGQRLTFAHLFEHANRHLAGATVIVANADIYFDETLAHLAAVDLTDQLLALSRWDVRADGSSVHFDRADSQDAWVFRAPIRAFPCDWHLGLPGCDNRLAREAADAGLRVTNPSRSIRAHHLHLSGARRYSARQRLHGPTLHVPSSLLPEVPPMPTSPALDDLAAQRFEQVATLLRAVAGDHLPAHTLDEIRGAIGRAVVDERAERQPALDASSMLALTSLSPDPQAYDVQREAVRSWVAAGLRPVSFNHPSEMAALARYEEVTLVPVEDTAHAQFGRHYVPIRRMLDRVVGLDTHVALINADIVLRCEPWQLERAAWRADAGVCYLVRHNHDGDVARAVREPYGIDAFVLHTRHATALEESFLCMGKPFWDYWVPHAFAARGLPVHTLADAVAFHRNHPQRWSTEDWHRCALEFDRLTRQLGDDRSLGACYGMSARIRGEIDRGLVSIPATPTPIRTWVTQRFQSGASKTFLELGAHQGTDTAWMAAIPGVTLHAFEPDPRNHPATLPNVVLNRAAVSDRDGRAPFVLSQEGWNQVWTYSSSLRRPHNHLTRYPVTFGAPIEVDTVALDTYASERGLGVVDFIWADIQGAEGDMIRGAQRLLARTRYLYTEFSDDEMYEGQVTLRQILAALPGWRVVELYPDDVLLENTRCTM